MVLQKNHDHTIALNKLLLSKSNVLIIYIIIVIIYIIIVIVIIIMVKNRWKVHFRCST